MKPHPFDPFSLVVGLSLLVLGIAGFAGSVDLDGIERNAVVPIALLAMAAAIASTVRRTTHRDEADPAEEEGI